MDRSLSPFKHLAQIVQLHSAQYTELFQVANVRLLVPETRRALASAELCDKKVYSLSKLDELNDGWLWEFQHEELRGSAKTNELLSLMHIINRMTFTWSLSSILKFDFEANCLECSWENKNRQSSKIFRVIAVCYRTYSGRYELENDE